MNTTLKLLLTALLCGVASAETAKVSQLTIGVPRISAPESKLKIVGYECVTNTIRYSRHIGWETNLLVLKEDNTTFTNINSVRATTNMPAAVVHSVTFGKDGVPLFVLKAQIALPINTDGGNWKNDEWRDLYSYVWAEHPPAVTNVVTVQAMNVTNVFAFWTTNTQTIVSNTTPRSHWQKWSTNGIVDKTVEEVVGELVESGEFCRVRGHDWQMGCGISGCLVMHNSPIRHCAVCNKVESQEVGPWK